jgi:hypothetical protein
MISERSLRWSLVARPDRLACLSEERNSLLQTSRDQDRVGPGCADMGLLSFERGVAKPLKHLIFGRAPWPFAFQIGLACVGLPG